MLSMSKIMCGGRKFNRRAEEAPARTPRASFLATLCALLAFGCDDGSPPAMLTTACCSDSAAPAYLQSKIDDDDGDGNPYDEDFPRINDEDDDIADHAWVRDDLGVYHLYFQTEDHGAGSFIEHYTSIDLQSLEYAGVALRPNQDGWDSYALWAPYVVRSGGTYFMFYTGTDGPGGDPYARQRIGLAASRDLASWTRCPANNCPGSSGAGCVYDCDESWTTWGEAPGSYNQQCRDPFVIWDEPRRQWLMLTTAKSRNGFGVVTAAVSTNLVDWRGVGFIDATRRLDSGAGAQTTGGQAENPFVTLGDGAYYLIFTDWQDPEDSVTTANPRTITQYATSRSLAVDSSGSAGWVYRGSIPDPGVNAIEVLRSPGNLTLMSESISNERSGLWPRRRQLRLRCVTWSPDGGFTLSNPGCGTRGPERLF